MKKLISSILVVLCVLTLSSCSKPKFSIDLTNVEKLDLIHIIGGQEYEIIIENDELNNVIEWIEKLETKHKSFEKGKSPGDAAGQEVFEFASNGKHLFSYVKWGEDEGFILYDDEWYVVNNPSDPISSLK